MKKSSRPRASDPIDRPGRRARSNTACGWFELLVGQQPAQGADHRGGPGRAVPGGEVGDEVTAATPVGRPVRRSGAPRGPAARSGSRCQQREHIPSPECRRSSPQTRQIRGGSFGGPGLEHDPAPTGLGAQETRSAAPRARLPSPPRRSARRRQGRQRLASRARTGPPHSVQRREHSTHRPVSAFRHPVHAAARAGRLRRGLPDAGACTGSSAPGR